MRRGPVRGVTLALALALVASAVLADEAPRSDEPEPEAATAQDDGDWDVSLAAYAWATDITGNARVGDVSLDVNPQLWNDILYNVNGGLMTAIEGVYRDRWIVNLDVFGSISETDSEAGPYRVGFGPRTFVRGLRPIQGSIPVETRVGTLQVPVRVDPGVVRVDVPRVETQIGPWDVDVESILAQARLAVGYRLFDVAALELVGRGAAGDRRRVSVDVLAGARYWYLHTEIDIDSPPIEVEPFEIETSVSGGTVRAETRIPTDAVALPTVRLRDVEFRGATFGGTDIHESAGSWWIDPFVGLRTRIDLCERVALQVAGNVGGFGIASASKFTWEALAFLDWRFGERWSFALGYRAIGLDREGGDQSADIILHGPLLGFVRAF